VFYSCGILQGFADEEEKKFSKGKISFSGREAITYLLSSSLGSHAVFFQYSSPLSLQEEMIK
jgi:hypothetical protein